MRSQELEIKNHIRRHRFEHGEMTQDQLAKQAGVTRHTIMALEAGKYFPSLLLAFRIAQVFGAHIEQVFEYRAAELNLCPNALKRIESEKRSPSGKLA